MDSELKQLLADIRKLYSGAKVYLFGSRARGDYREHSDYDLIVVSAKFGKTHFLKRTGNIWRNSDAGIAADIFCYTPEEFKRVSKESIVIRDALKYALAV